MSKRFHDNTLTLALVPVVEEVQPLMGASEWVLQKMGEVSAVVGLSFEGLEKEVWSLFF